MMATAIGNAKEMVDKVWTGVFGSGEDIPEREAIALAQAYAAIAQAEAAQEQAEQLKRIADALYVKYTNGSEESLIQKMTADITSW